MTSDLRRSPGSKAGNAATKPSGDEDGFTLTDQQKRAAELLVGGLRPGKVAIAVQISREQLWRWRSGHPGFRQYVNRLRVEFHAARVDRLWALTDKALDVVEEQLDEGDPQTAMGLLRLAGGRFSEPTPDPADVADAPQGAPRAPSQEGLPDLSRKSIPDTSRDSSAPADGAQPAEAQAEQPKEATRPRRRVAP
jgi:hypothetical protein